jgi:hypothetical protein
MFITLSPRLTEQHREFIHRYLVDDRVVWGRDWVIVLEAFDLLGESYVQDESGKHSFSTVYREQIEHPFADGYIVRLLDSEEDLEHIAPRLSGAVARQIGPRLRKVGLYDPAQPITLYLLAYCYYSWDIFARGYQFEVSIFRDLTESGIAYIAHDIRRRAGRLSRSDVVVMGYEGDIKTSPYFLQTTRTKALTRDFYITRLYDRRRRKRVRVALLSERFWREIDGDTIATTIEEATNVFPRVAQIPFADGRLIVIGYEAWKARLLARQEGE